MPLLVDGCAEGAMLFDHTLLNHYCVGSDRRIPLAANDTAILFFPVETGTR